VLDVEDDHAPLGMIDRINDAMSSDAISKKPPEYDMSRHEAVS